MFARSADGGETLVGYGIDTALPTPVTKHWTGIVAAVLGFVPPGGTQAVLYTAPETPAVRSNLSARTSRDGGHTWSAPRSIYPGLSGYSDLVPAPGGVGVIFENGDRTFSDRISYTLLPLSWLP
jgi:hypothetical protein